MKKITRTSTRTGPIISDVYSKVKTRTSGNKVVNKSVTANVVTDLANQKTTASGMKTKTVTKNGIVTKSKSKPLSARQSLYR